MTTMDVLQRALRGLQGADRGQDHPGGLSSGHYPLTGKRISGRSSPVKSTISGTFHRNACGAAPARTLPSAACPCKHILLAMLDFELRFAHLGTLVVEEEGRLMNGVLVYIRCH